MSSMGRAQGRDEPQFLASGAEAGVGELMESVFLCLGRTSIESRYWKPALFSDTIILFLLNLGTTLLDTFFCVTIFL